MAWLRIGGSLTGVAVCAAAFAMLWPHAYQAGHMLAAQDDPAELSEMQVNSVLRNDPGAIERQIEAALAANDADLASSFVDVAAAHRVALPDALLGRVNDAVAEANSTSHMVKRFATGLVTGNADDGASLSGTVAGDLFVFGDIRDVVREGSRYANDEKYDELVLGLACAGIALTAGTYLSFGAAAPVRVGLSAVKAEQQGLVTGWNSISSTRVPSGS